MPDKFLIKSVFVLKKDYCHEFFKIFFSTFKSWTNIIGVFAGLVNGGELFLYDPWHLLILLDL